MERPPWHHRPNHLFLPDRCYMVTAGTLHKRRLFQTGIRLQMLHDALLQVFTDHGWQVDAWAVFENHYHIVAVSPPTGAPLQEVVQELHSMTARELNRLDGTPGRRVWFQFWDTCLSFAPSFHARIRCVMTNPVKHGLVQDEGAYPWGCARWFEQNLDPHGCGGSSHTSADG